MTQADRTPTTSVTSRQQDDAPPAAGAAASSRRRLLGGLALGAVTTMAPVAAVLSPDPVWGALPTAAGPDAELIAACRAFDALEVQEAALYRGATVEDEERFEPEAAALSRQQAGLIGTICATRPVTPAGHLARARTLAMLEDVRPDVADQQDAPWDARLAAAIARDLAAEILS